MDYVAAAEEMLDRAGAINGNTSAQFIAAGNIYALLAVTRQFEQFNQREEKNHANPS